ncbi:ParA family protein [uncultured Deinococcus sp.]|uniref:ParA family protein n=1 Tax=uncultured Deinococcus sp. TaxID=158789 RepID=UPI0025FA6F0D|nr:ParA family protein [uncultured Deinococcus sp.]
MKTIAVLSLKGGVGKTTTTVYLAAVAAAAGHHVTIVDADSEHSAHRWASHAELPFTVVAGEPDRLARQVKAPLAEGHLVIIDTPPNSRELLMRAASLADIALVPVAPTGLEIDRLRPTLELLADMQAQREDLDVAILLTRYNPRRRLAKEAEDALVGLPVLESRVRELEAYKAAFGAEPTDLGEYEAVWKELMA